MPNTNESLSEFQIWTEQLGAEYKAVQGLTGCSYRRTIRGRGWLRAGPAGPGPFYWRVQPCGREWTADGATGLGVIYPVTSHI